MPAAYSEGSYLAIGTGYQAVEEYMEDSQGQLACIEVDRMACGEVLVVVFKPLVLPLLATTNLLRGHVPHQHPQPDVQGSSSKIVQEQVKLC